MADDLFIRVCFISPKAYPLFNPDVKGVFGGAEVDLYFLATELAKDKDFAVSCLTADYGQQETETIEGVRIIKTLNFKENPLVGAVKVWKGLRKADAQIYFQKAASWGTFLVALFCKFHKRIFFYRTASEQECDGTYIKQHPVFGKMCLWALKTAAHVFVQNKIDGQNLLRTTGISSTVIPNGHRLVELRQCQRDTILWVGRSAEIKGPTLFTYLAEKVPNQKFTMICQRATGDDKYDQLLARASQVENLEFIQHVDFNAIDTYFQQAKIFVNTSKIEGFPNTFIQACQYATPILSLNVDPDGFLVQYNCGICCNGSMECLVDSLRFMLAENRFIEFGKNARRYAEQNHNIKQIAGEYKRLFAGLLRPEKVS
jgi:glycosyltransferase involved in cell wall biosynthesis